MNSIVKRKPILIILIVLMAASLWIVFYVDGATSASNTYYVDSKNGNDKNSGKSPSSAWKSLAKVNKTTFKPGDRILFKAGGVWNGELHPLGSGAQGKPIMIDRYGKGAKPLIQGGGRTRAIFLFNQEFWSIGNLEITNYAPQAAKGPRRGIEIAAENYKAGTKTDLVNIAKLRQIRLHNLYIHDVNGEDIKDGNGSSAIHIVVLYGEKPIKRATTFDGITIENNVIDNVQRTGIMLNSAWSSREQHDGDAVDPNRPWIPITNVVIRGNKLTNIGGDGIVPHVTQGALVEKNKLDGFNRTSTGYNAGMWTYNGDFTLYQYNEVSGGVSTRDGMAFDFDHGSRGIVYQYNFSHDNEGGTLLICNNQPGGGVYDGVFRYNISQNDRYQTFSICEGSNAYNMQFYNNVFYVGEGIQTDMLVSEGGQTEVQLANNIFYNLGSGGYGAKSSWSYDHNVFYGNAVPSPDTIPDPSMIAADPLFVRPGTATRIGDLSGYKLLADSPALAGGTRVVSRSIQDMWGNRTLAFSPPNLGAYNGPGEGAE